MCVPELDERDSLRKEGEKEGRKEDEDEEGVRARSGGEEVEVGEREVGEYVREGAVEGRLREERDGVSMRLWGRWVRDCG